MQIMRIYCVKPWYTINVINDATLHAWVDPNRITGLAKWIVVLMVTEVHWAYIE